MSAYCKFSQWEVAYSQDYSAAAGRVSSLHFCYVESRQYALTMLSVLTVTFVTTQLSDVCARDTFWPAP